jgi:hypothetical protein
MEYNTVPTGGWYFRKTFSLPTNASNISGSVQIDADNAYTLSINGHAVGGAGAMSKDGPDTYTWETVNTWNVAQYLTAGQNTILIRALNYFDGPGYDTSSNNPAGLIFMATINSTTPAPLSVSAPTPTTATHGTPYTLTPTASGGTPPYTWSTINKPSWLSLNASTGVMTGTPDWSAVTATFTLQVKDKVGATATTSVTIVVPAVPVPTITATTPTTATIGTAYTLTPTASGGAGAPYTWSSINKPSWLSLNASTGVLSGTPGTSAATVTFTLQVKDKNWQLLPPGTQATKELTITVNPAPVPTITATTPTTATIGTAYTLTPTASGGTGPPYTWSSINKPSWLSLNASTGVLSGTPGTSATTVTFTLQVQDKIGTTATKTLTITVNPAPVPTISATPTTATIEAAYTLTPTASGGTPPYTWSSAGKPSWLSLNASTGVLSGTPNASAVSVTFTLQVNDKIGGKATASITINVVKPDPIVNFPDAGLQAAIRAAINKPTGDIHASDLTVLTALDAHNMYNQWISNLSGIEYCTNLTSLQLYENHITDLTPLAGLNKLTLLYLDHNIISSLTPLAGLKNLTSLTLNDNQISNLMPLAGLKNLTSLTLNDNQISNLTPLAGLIALQSLTADHNQISSLTGLAGLTNLKGLYLNHNQISSLIPLAGLNQLTILDLDINNVSDLTPLVGHTSLQGIYLTKNNVSNLTPLAGLTSLKYVQVDNNNIIDIAPLVNNTGLGTGDWVNLVGNLLSSTSVNTYIPALQARGVSVSY